MRTVRSLRLCETVDTRFRLQGRLLLLWQASRPMLFPMSILSLLDAFRCATIVQHFRHAASGGNFDCLHKSVSLFSEKPNKIAAILPRKQVCFSASSIAAWESVPFIMLIYGIKYKFTRKFQANFISVFAISTYLYILFNKTQKSPEFPHLTAWIAGIFMLQ